MLGPRRRGGEHPPRVLGVVVHPSRSVAASLEVLGRWAGTHDTRVLAREADRARLVAQGADQLECAGDDAFADAVDAVVSLGGDGTMLGALRLVAERPVPVIGVNHGHLGFLVELSPDGLDAALGQLVAGRYTVEPHHGLRLERSGGRGEPPIDPSVAYNDIALRGRGPAWGVSVDLEVNGERYGYYRADALVIATPTGSTAYSYAAGGPVLSPSVGATVVTPVAPSSGIARSVVFAADDILAFHVHVSPSEEPAGAGASVDVDGVPAGWAGAGHAVTVTPLAEPAQVVRLDSGAHGQRSRVKLSLLDLPLRPDQLRELVPPELRRHLE